VTSCLVTLPGIGLEISSVWVWEWQREWDFRGRGVGRFCWGVGEGMLWILKGSPGAMSTRAGERGTKGWRGE
jgi:hypothetical protein